MEYVYGNREPFGGYSAARLDAKNLEERVGYFLNQNQPIPPEVFVEYISNFLSDKDASDLMSDIAELESKLEEEQQSRRALQDVLAEKDTELQLLLQELVIDKYEGKNIPDEVIEKIAKLVPNQPTDNS